MHGSVRVRREREDVYASSGSDDEYLTSVGEMDSGEESDQPSTGVKDASSNEGVSSDFCHTIHPILTKLTNLLSLIFPRAKNQIHLPWRTSASAP
jgi:hypothetical protein